MEILKKFAENFSIFSQCFGILLKNKIASQNKLFSISGDYQQKKTISLQKMIGQSLGVFDLVVRATKNYHFFDVTPVFNNYLERWYVVIHQKLNLSGNNKKNKYS